MLFSSHLKGRDPIAFSIDKEENLVHRPLVVLDKTILATRNESITRRLYAKKVTETKEVKNVIEPRIFSIQEDLYLQTSVILSLKYGVYLDADEGRTGKMIAINISEDLKSKSLNLSGREINILSNGIASFRRLTTLDLSNNELYYLPCEISKLLCLEELLLSSNNLKSVPKVIFSLPGLKILELQQNKLESVPLACGQLKNLRELNISDNKIRELPREIGQLKKLAILEARNNLLGCIPAEICLLTQLKRILLDGNPLLLTDNVSRNEGFVNIEPKDRIAPLFEFAARIFTGIKGKDSLPSLLSSSLSHVQECFFCNGVFFSHFYSRIRTITRQDQQIPIKYYLCSAHWNDETGRLKAMFEKVPLECAQLALFSLDQRTTSLHNFSRKITIRHRTKMASSFLDFRRISFEASQ